MNNDDKFSNKSIAELLRFIATAYVLRGEKENRFRIIAYERAADAVEHLSRELRDIWQEGKLQKVNGIGPGIASSLSEYFEKGQSRHFNDLLKGIPPSVFALTKVPGIGPKRAFQLVSSFGLTDPDSVIDDLMNEARAGNIAELEGFGEKSQQDIIESLQVYQKKDRREERMPLPFALNLSEKLTEYLEEIKEVQRVDVLGSLRRRVSTIGDIDVSVMAEDTDAKKIVDHFLEYPGKRSIEGAGQRKASIIAAGNVRMDLRVQDKTSYGSMLQYFTGSKSHNIQLREFAQRKGYSLSEYGVKELEGRTSNVEPRTKKNDKERVHTFETEEELYSFLGLQYIPPEMREGTNEIEVALKNNVPSLVELADIKGDFHMHSSYDIQTSHDLGLNSYEELAENAKSLKYEYIGFTDHNPKHTGLSDEEVITIMKDRKQYIDKVLSSANIPYFIGLEVDVLPDGNLALPEKAFAYVDYLVVSIHSSFKMDQKEMTERVMKALKHQKVKIFGHPSARLLGKRDGVDVDWSQVFEYSAKHNIAMEINAGPSRLDLSDTLARDARELGVKFTINTDAHAVEHMKFMRFGVSVARRAWLTKENIINTKPYKEVKEWMES